MSNPLFDGMTSSQRKVWKATLNLQRGQLNTVANAAKDLHDILRADTTALLCAAHMVEAGPVRDALLDITLKFKNEVYFLRELVARPLAEIAAKTSKDMSKRTGAYRYTVEDIDGEVERMRQRGEKPTNEALAERLGISTRQLYNIKAKSKTKA